MLYAAAYATPLLRGTVFTVLLRCCTVLCCVCCDYVWYYIMYAGTEWGPRGVSLCPASPRQVRPRVAPIPAKPCLLSPNPSYSVILLPDFGVIQHGSGLSCGDECTQH
eukprot:90182-Rhodomonas_salina.1